jgi:CRISPR-associated protein Cmr2
LVLEDFYKQKIAALLHDPPSKCWFIDGSRGIGDHRKEAKQIAEKLFDQDIAKLVFANQIEKADHLASSLDRWILEVAMGGKYEPSSYLTKSSKLLNQFTRDSSDFYSIETPIPHDFESRMNSFITSLEDLLNEEQYQGNWRIIYHILYSCLEYCWAKEVGSIGPADTRVPTHSIFDHLYATATALNMLGEDEKISGYLVTIDLAGIQSFVTAARKMLDLWAGSWLVSALAWSIVEDFVKIMGPDILILPTARANPFYFHTFRGLTKLSGKVEKYRRIGESFYGYFNYPSNPVIPGTISFLMPKRDEVILQLERETALKFRDEREIYQSIKGIYRQKWEKLCKALVDDQIRESCDRLGIFNVPPLRVRVAVEDISNSSSSGEQAHNGTVCNSKQHSSNDEYLTYHRAFHRVASKLREQSSLKISPFVDLKLTENTNQHYSVCHVCGLLPRAKTEEQENLCAYCAIRRNLARKEGISKSLDALFGFHGLSETKTFRILPSVSDIAARPFVYELCKTKDEKIRNVAWKQRDWIPWIEHCEELSKGWHFIGEINAEAKLFGDAEKREGSEEVKQKASRLLRELKDSGFAKILNPYFAILRADTDNMGKLVSGLIGPSGATKSVEHGGVSSLKFDIFDHLCRSVENQRLRNVLQAISKKDFDTAADIASKEFFRTRTKEDLANDFKCLYLRLQEGCSFASKENSRDWRSNLILSPSYHATLSRALMKLATETTQIIQKNGGEPIYAGGDDLVAVLPAEKAFESAWQIRNKFRQDEGGPSGFLKLLENTQAYVFSMGDLGVSMSVLFTHRKFPLSVSLEESIKNEDELAKKTKWTDEKRNILAEKDALAVEYLPRGGQRITALIPIYDNVVIDLVMKITSLLRFDSLQTFTESAALSKSFLRDLSEQYEEIEWAYATAQNDSRMRIVESLLNRIVVRNSRDMMNKKKKNENEINRLTNELFKMLTISGCRMTTDKEGELKSSSDKVSGRLLGEVIKASLAINGATS